MQPMRRRSPALPRLPGGFTLLEVLMAIALSTVLLALLASAINLYLIRVDVSRSTVEQAQLARGVLRLISDDLRNVAVLYEQDISSAQAAASSQALFDVDEVDLTPPQQDVDEQSESTRPYVGVTGDAASIQVDVLRVRPAYRAAVDDPAQPITITYETPGVSSVRYQLGEQGLLRQQVNRDQAIQEAERGTQQAWDASTRVVAAEVVELRFRYHDGQQALEYWDLEQQEGASPLAVEVTIGLRSSIAEAQSPEQEQQGETTAVRYYRILAPLRAAPAAGDSQEDSAQTGDSA